MDDATITLKKRAISCYVSLSELKSYVQLNWTGFSKILKKYDKTCNRDLRPYYLAERVEKQYPFLATTRDTLNEKINGVEGVYARICTDEDISEAHKELKRHLREHVVWERNTVWRDMIGIERKAQSAALGFRSTLLGRQKETDALPEVSRDVCIRTPVGNVTLPRWCPGWLFSVNMATLVIAFAIFFSLLYIPLFESVEQSNCLAMLAFVSVLWATEVLPQRTQLM
jgi:phosphate transporter